MFSRLGQSWLAELRSAGRPRAAVPTWAVVRTSAPTWAVVGLVFLRQARHRDDFSSWTKLTSRAALGGTAGGGRPHVGRGEDICPHVGRGEDICPHVGSGEDIWPYMSSYLEIS